MKIFQTFENIVSISIIRSNSVRQNHILHSRLTAIIFTCGLLCQLASFYDDKTPQEYSETIYPVATFLSSIFINFVFRHFGDEIFGLIDRLETEIEESK